MLRFCDEVYKEDMWRNEEQIYYASILACQTATSRRSSNTSNFKVRSSSATNLNAVPTSCGNSGCDATADGGDSTGVDTGNGGGVDNCTSADSSLCSSDNSPLTGVSGLLSLRTFLLHSGHWPMVAAGPFADLYQAGANRGLHHRLCYLVYCYTR
ncbi:hypothetical protein PYW08_006724 [Mythimna loreyi]|uniref:Uncharacterized protein n=1 Tax=Mythimna loreyi TaxID=667449 RepID=A0ACC2RA91_9NEOP|nr:hypothetical protein PYW08_006724 [Mythimna loreyi]